MRVIAVGVPCQARILAATRQAEVEDGSRDFLRSVERALDPQTAGRVRGFRGGVGRAVGRSATGAGSGRGTAASLRQTRAGASGLSRCGVRGREAGQAGREGGRRRGRLGGTAGLGCGTHARSARAAHPARAHTSLLEAAELVQHRQRTIRMHGNLGCRDRAVAREDERGLLQAGRQGGGAAAGAGCGARRDTEASSPAPLPRRPTHLDAAVRGLVHRELHMAAHAAQRPMPPEPQLAGYRRHEPDIVEKRREAARGG